MMNGKWLGVDRIPPGLQNQGPQIPWYEAAQLNDSSATANAAAGVFGPAAGPRVELGSCWQDPFTGNSFQYVKAGGALAAGQIVTPIAPTTGTVTAAGSTVDTIITNIDTTLLGSLTGNYIFFYNAATAGSQSLRVIKGHTTGTNASIVVSKRSLLTGTATSSSTTVTNVMDADVLSAVPANGSACAIIRPWTVEVNPTTPRVGVGVALGTVTSGNFTIIQISGLALVLAKGDIAVNAVGIPAIYDATTAGFVNGGTANVLAGRTVIPLTVSVAGDTAAAATLRPFLVNFIDS